MASIEHSELNSAVDDEENLSSSKKPLIASPIEKLKAETPKPVLLEDVLSSIPLGPFHYKMLFLVGSGYFAVCSEMMLFIFLSSPVRKEWDLKQYDFPWLPFCTGISAICGGYVAGVISDKFGRRLPFLVGMIIIAVFGLASALAPTFPVFILLRCLVTVGIGTFEAVGFVLLVEFLPCKRRGTILVVVTLCGAFGAVFAGGFAWLVLPGLGWRWFVGVCAAPSLAVLVFQPFAFYESPRHLFICGKKNEARKVLAEMARLSKWDIPRLDEVEFSLEVTSRASKGNILRLFSKDHWKKTFLFSCLWLLQATGYWGVTTYLPEYMDSLGVNSHLNMFSVFIGEIPGLLLTMYLIEKRKCGRTGCLRIFSAMTATSLFVFAFIPKHILKSVLIVACFFSMVPIYSILNTLTPEVYPTHLRSTAMAWMNVLIEIPGLTTPFIGATLLSSDIPWLYPLVWGTVFAVQFLVTLVIGFETVGEKLIESQSISKSSDPSEPEKEDYENFIHCDNNSDIQR